MVGWKEADKNVQQNRTYPLVEILWSHEQTKQTIMTNENEVAKQIDLNGRVVT
jgi:hypothetical protein